MLISNVLPHSGHFFIFAIVFSFALATNVLYVYIHKTKKSDFMALNVPTVYDILTVRTELAKQGQGGQMWVGGIVDVYPIILIPDIHAFKTMSTKYKPPHRTALFPAGCSRFFPLAIKRQAEAFLGFLPCLRSGHHPFSLL
jgi:hypothetical protein